MKIPCQCTVHCAEAKNNFPSITIIPESLLRKVKVRFHGTLSPTSSNINLLEGWVDICLRQSLTTLKTTKLNK